jgi:predicted phosphodiesterase
MSRDTDFKDMLNSASEARQDKNRFKVHEQIIKEQQAIIDGLTASKVPALKGRKHLLDGKPIIQMVISDIHGSAHDRAAVAAMLGDMEILKPDRIINLGDFIDCSGFLAEHFTLGFVAETGYSYPEDILIGNDLLDQMQSHTKEMYYLFGNHEHRVEKYIVTESLKKRTDRNWLVEQMMRVLSVESLLSLEQRGINFVRPGETKDGTYIQASVKLGKSLYIHHGFTGPNGAKKMLSEYQMNVAYGHTHKAVNLQFREAGGGKTMVSRNYGCLCRQQPMWHHTRPSGWTTGYGLEIMQEDGSFLPLSIPIVNGVSLLAALSNRLA